MLKIKIIVLMMTLGFVNFNIDGQKTVRIYGRVVDEQGNPINKAQVGIIIYPFTCKGCVDNLIQGLETSEEGLFSFGWEEIRGAKKVTIVIETEIPNGYYKIFNTYGGTENYYPDKYKGINIITRKKREINLGNVYPQVSWAKLQLDLSRYVSPSEIDSYKNINFGFQDKSGKTLQMPVPIPSRFWENKSSVRVAVPKGKSIVILNFNNKSNKNISRKLLVEIDSLLQITITEIDRSLL